MSALQDYPRPPDDEVFRGPVGPPGAEPGGAAPQPVLRLHRLQGKHFRRWKDLAEAGISRDSARRLRKQLQKFKRNARRRFLRRNERSLHGAPKIRKLELCPEDFGEAEGAQRTFRRPRRRRKTHQRTKTNGSIEDCGRMSKQQYDCPTLHLSRPSVHAPPLSLPWIPAPPMSPPLFPGGPLEKAFCSASVKTWEVDKRMPGIQSGALDKLPGMQLGAVDKLPGMQLGLVDKLPGMQSGALDKLPGMQLGLVDKLPGIQSGALDKLPGMQLGLVDKLPGIQSGAVDKLPGMQSGAVDKLPGMQLGAVDKLPGMQLGLVDKLPGMQSGPVDKKPGNILGPCVDKLPGKTSGPGAGIGHLPGTALSEGTLSLGVDKLSGKIIGLGSALSSVDKLPGKTSGPGTDKLPGKTSAGIGKLPGSTSFGETSGPVDRLPGSATSGMDKQPGSTLFGETSGPLVDTLPGRTSGPGVHKQPGKTLGHSIDEMTRNIPSGIAKLPGKTLGHSIDEMTGNIPSGNAKLPGKTVGHNIDELAGSTPSEIAKLSGKTVGYSIDKMTGNAPSGIAKLPGKTLGHSIDKMTGNIPSEVAKLPGKTLGHSIDKMTGNAPSGIANLPGKILVPGIDELAGSTRTGKVSEPCVNRLPGYAPPGVGGSPLVQRLAAEEDGSTQVFPACGPPTLFPPSRLAVGPPKYAPLVPEDLSRTTQAAAFDGTVEARRRESNWSREVPDASSGLRFHLKSLRGPDAVSTAPEASFSVGLPLDASSNVPIPSPGVARDSLILSVPRAPPVGLSVSPMVLIPATVAFEMGSGGGAAVRASSKGPRPRPVVQASIPVSRVTSGSPPKYYWIVTPKLPPRPQKAARKASRSVMSTPRAPQSLISAPRAPQSVMSVSKARLSVMSTPRSSHSVTSTPAGCQPVTSSPTSSPLVSPPPVSASSFLASLLKAGVPLIPAPSTQDSLAPSSVPPSPSLRTSPPEEGRPPADGSSTKQPSAGATCSRPTLQTPERSATRDDSTRVADDASFAVPWDAAGSSLPGAGGRRKRASGGQDPKARRRRRKNPEEDPSLQRPPGGGDGRTSEGAPNDFGEEPLAQSAQSDFARRLYGPLDAAVGADLKVRIDACQTPEERVCGLHASQGVSRKTWGPKKKKKVSGRKRQSDLETPMGREIGDRTGAVSPSLPAAKEEEPPPPLARPSREASPDLFALGRVKEELSWTLSDATTKKACWKRLLVRVERLTHRHLKKKFLREHGISTRSGIFLRRKLRRFDIKRDLLLHGRRLPLAETPRPRAAERRRKIVSERRSVARALVPSPRPTDESNSGPPDVSVPSAPDPPPRPKALPRLTFMGDRSDAPPAVANERTSGGGGVDVAAASSKSRQLFVFRNERLSPGQVHFLSLVGLGEAMKALGNADLDALECPTDHGLLGLEAGPPPPPPPPPPRGGGGDLVRERQFRVAQGPALPRYPQGHAYALPGPNGQDVASGRVYAPTVVPPQTQGLGPPQVQGVERVLGRELAQGSPYVRYATSRDAWNGLGGEWGESSRQKRDWNGHAVYWNGRSGHGADWNSGQGDWGSHRADWNGHKAKWNGHRGDWSAPRGTRASPPPPLTFMGVGGFSAVAPKAPRGMPPLSFMGPATSDAPARAPAALPRAPDAPPYGFVGGRAPDGPPPALYAAPRGVPYPAHVPSRLSLGPPYVSREERPPTQRRTDAGRRLPGVLEHGLPRIPSSVQVSITTGPATSSSATQDSGYSRGPTDRGTTAQCVKIINQEPEHRHHKSRHPEMMAVTEALILQLVDVGLPTSMESLIHTASQLFEARGTPDPPFCCPSEAQSWYGDFHAAHLRLLPGPDAPDPGPPSDARARDWVAGVELDMAKFQGVATPPRVFYLQELHFFLDKRTREVKYHRMFPGRARRPGEKDSVTALFVACADGAIGPGMITFPRMVIPERLFASLKATRGGGEWVLGSSADGRLYGDCVSEFVGDVFVPWLRRGGAHFPVALFASERVSEAPLAEMGGGLLAQGVQLVAVPRALAGTLSPAERTVGDFLRRRWGRAVRDWSLSNDLKPLLEENFPPFLIGCLTAQATPQRVRAKFVEFGICPFDAQAMLRCLRSHRL